MDKKDPKFGWKPVVMVGVKNKKLYKYKAYLCPVCDNEVLVPTNFCSTCGKFHSGKLQEARKC